MQVVVMAAGMGSRFGGLKQMEPMDAYGNFILDYSIVDAKEAGFDEVVFIIKKDFFEDFKNTIGKRLEKIISVKYAFQDLNDLPEGFKVPNGRIKPWGTGQAILAARDLIKDHFIVINGDDYYGKETYKVAYDYLANLPKNAEGEYANIAFEVANTMTENGAVKRGVIFEDEKGNLTKLIESSVEYQGEEVLATPLDSNIKPFKIDRKMPVSMNLFCFTKDFLKELQDRFVPFLKEHGEELKSEYLLPDIASEAVMENKASIKVLRSSAIWYGITYQDDKEKVYNALANLRKQGLYKETLY